MTFSLESGDCCPFLTVPSGVPQYSTCSTGCTLAQPSYPWSRVRASVWQTDPSPNRVTVQRAQNNQARRCRTPRRHNCTAREMGWSRRPQDPQLEEHNEGCHPSTRQLSSNSETRTGRGTEGQREPRPFMLDGLDGLALN